MIQLTAHQVQLLSFALMLPFAAYLVTKIRPAVLLSLGLALEVFSGHWLTMGLRLPLDRLLLLAGFFSIAMNRETREAVFRKLPTIMPLLIAVSVYVVVSGAVAHTIFGGKGFWMLFDRLGFFPFAAFVVAPVVFASKSDRDFFFKTFIVLGTYLSVTAIFEVIGPKAFVFPAYITDPLLPAHLGRGRGPFVEAVPNGMAMFSCGVLALLGSQQLANPRWRMWAMWAVPLCGVGAFLSLTRSVWFGSLAGIVVAVAFTPSVRKRLFVGAGVLAMLIAVLYFTVPGLSERVTGRVEDQAPIWDRENTNNAALAMVRDSPLFGVGWDSFVGHSPDYLRQSGDTPLTGANIEVHNMFLAFTSELGLVGITLWSACVLSAIGTAVTYNWQKSRRPVAVAVLAVFCSWAAVAALSPLDQAFPHLLMWMFCGIAVAMARDAEAGEPVDVREVVRV